MAIPSRWYKPRRRSSQTQQGVGSNPPPQSLPSTRLGYLKSTPPDHFPLFAKMSSTNLRLGRGRLGRATLRNEYEPKPNQNRIRKPANSAQCKPSATNAKLTQIPLSTPIKGNGLPDRFLPMRKNIFNKLPPGAEPSNLLSITSCTALSFPPATRADYNAPSQPTRPRQTDTKAAPMSQQARSSPRPSDICAKTIYRS